MALLQFRYLDVTQVAANNMDRLFVLLPRDIQYKYISRQLLIFLHLNDVANFKLTPSFGLEDLLLLGEENLIYWFFIYFFSCGPQLILVNYLQNQVDDKTQRANDVDLHVQFRAKTFVINVNQ